MKISQLVSLRHKLEKLLVLSNTELTSIITQLSFDVEQIQKSVSVFPFTDAIDISANYVGQSSITTLGTITTGTWNGNTVGVGYGGTGTTSFTSKGVLYGNGSSAIQVTSASLIDGSFLRADANGTPYFSNVIDGGTY